MSAGAFLFGLSPVLLLTIAIVVSALPALDCRRNGHRLLIVALFAFLAVRYYYWRISGVILYGAQDGAGGWFAWPVLGFELLGIAEAIVAVVMLSRTVDRKPETDAKAAALAARPDAELPTVDVFIATYNEGMDVLEKTILGAMALDWPTARLKVWVLDDGRRGWLREFCAAKRVGYLTRPNNAHAKAGNINAALRQTSGEFVAVFDADFVPRRNFLRRTIGWFDDPKIGIVQAPHHFYNADPIQANLLMDGMLPDDQRIFFDTIQPSRDAWDAAFCCGSLGVLRRSAIDEIGGGIPTESITEDILTTLALKRRGYITRFVNEKLAFGLAAESVEAFFVQRKRWLRGGIQLMFLRNGPLGPGLRLIDRLLFFPTNWIVQYTIRIFGLAMPVICLWTPLSPLPKMGTSAVLSYQAPMFLGFIAMMRWLSAGYHVPLLTPASQCFAAFRLVPTMLGSLVKPFGVPFRVTPKGLAIGSARLDRITFSMALVLFLATILGIAIHILPNGGASDGFFPVVMFWSSWNLIVLAVVLLMCIEVPRRRSEHRFDADELVGVIAADFRAAGRAKDFSLHGARMLMPTGMQARAGQRLVIRIRGIGRVPAAVIDQAGAALRVLFDWQDEAMRERMIVKLFASGAHEVGLRPVSVAHVLAATWRRAFGATWLDAYGASSVANANTASGHTPSMPPKTATGAAVTDTARAAAGR
ncbi:MAG TPA: glycosyltransferase [Candidatus Acidoferrum sp.]|nr:glycosyltransferase [Candidatus Acidoferrum sp.]